MQPSDAKLLAEIKRIETSAAQTLLRTARLSTSMEGEELAEVSTWVTALGQVIRRLYGERSEQFATFSKAVATQNFYHLHSNWRDHIAILLGLVKGIKHDIETGLLADLRSLMQAEVFTDFLEMGEYLLQEGYKDAAAVLIGAVLEDALRKLSARASLPLDGANGKPLTMEPLNSQLAAAQAYSKLVQKQVTTWAHLRNKAAHGQYLEYGNEQVEMMLLFVQSFCAEHMQ
jgi:uncharacterized protein (DUF2164 family)